MSLLIRGASQLATPLGRSARRHGELGRVAVHTDWVVRCDDGTIAFVGPTAEHDARFPAADLVLDADGGCVIPAFVDPHTHPVWAGSREGEFNRRLRGESYMDIARSGGGINATVRATRAASFEGLLASTLSRLDRFLEHGTTTIEAKSGYGLDLATEIRMLEVIAAANRDHPVDLHPTCLAAHEVPPEHRGDTDGWVDRLVAEIHPNIARRGLAEAVDVFCEQGVFDLDQTRRLLADADSLGWRVHLHADELTPLGGAELAVELGALSADHLMCVTEAGIDALAGSETVAVLLPGTSFFLRTAYAPARRLVDAGCAVALATDCNPGSSPTESMPAILALATLGMGLSVEEALTAATLNAAAAIGRSAEIGSLEVGKRADIAVLAGPSFHHLVYHYGVNPIRHVVKNGRVVVRDRQLVARSR
ncbi:MAG: imidazolonepropionase [Thermoanaerobaculales bacterium]|jgi:imidazolonepropionase|nr:imidazolonepropionase [Thermoanaerobaculales bacterium]